MINVNKCNKKRNNPKELSFECRISKYKYEGKVTIWD